MDIEVLQKHWDEMGKSDPLWAIITHHDKKGNKWDTDKFFETGVEEISSVMQYIEELEFDFSKNKALDFGCGVGRLTLPLSHYFDEVHGVDIAKSMIELANEYNKYKDKCFYHLNKVDNLVLFKDNEFDFIYTNIVLQHMKPDYSKKYIKEFIRIVKPGGLIAFQIPSRIRVIDSNGKLNIKGLFFKIFPKKFLDLTYRKIKFGNKPRMEMYHKKKSEIIRFVEENGAKIVDIKENFYSGDTWESFQYFVTK